MNLPGRSTGFYTALDKSDGKEKAAVFRRQAALCLEVADRMSLSDDQARMIEMAQHFLKQAAEQDAKRD